METNGSLERQRPRPDLSSREPLMPLFRGAPKDKNLIPL